MKKYLILPVLALSLLAAGCSRELPPPTEAPTVTTAATAATETVPPETTAETAPAYDLTEVDAYLAAVKEEADGIRHYLEYDAMTQLDMNDKSLELYELWDDALNYLWGEVKSCLPEEEFSALLEEQRTWITEKEAAMTAAAKEVEGGSMYPLVLYTEGAKWTEARVYELYALLQ